MNGERREKEEQMTYRMRTKNQPADYWEEKKENASGINGEEDKSCSFLPSFQEF
jgi:hypothetical protein